MVKESSKKVDDEGWENVETSDFKLCSTNDLRDRIIQDRDVASSNQTSSELPEASQF